jgi:hypothetical protein
MSEQKSLGCMNSWGKPPVEYTHHMENCATEYEYKCMLGPGKFEMRKGNRYPMQSKTLRPCYTRYECEKCKCNWTVDSSD